MKKAAIGLIGLLVAAVLGILLVASVPLEPTVPRLESRPGTERWTMSGGYEIAYTRVRARDAAVDTGARTGAAPVVFLHGGPGGWVSASALRTFGRLADLGRDVYLYDQVGSGLSDRLDDPKDYSFLGHVGDLREIVTEHIGAERVVLVGHSYGGQLASYFTARHPGLVEKAVLSSPGGIQPARFDDEGRWLNERLYPVPDSLRFVPPRDISEKAKVGSWPLRAVVTVALATTLDVKWMPDDEADGVLNDIVTELAPGYVCDPAAVPDLEQGMGMGMYAHGWSNWFGDVTGWRDGLEAADVPVLVLQGQCDYMPYAGVYEHAALAPRGEYRFVEGAGHVLWWERPDEVVAEIRTFLAGPAGAFDRRRGGVQPPGRLSRRSGHNAGEVGLGQ